MGPSHLAAVDVDDMAALPEAERLFGPSPFRIRTSRGINLLYRSGGFNESKNLRESHGLPIDIKAGAGHVLFPPSEHRSGHVYSLMDSQWSDLARVPPFNAEPLGEALKQQDVALGGLGMSGAKITEGVRWLALRRLLAREGGLFDTSEELLAFADARNNEFDPPMERSQVERLARDTWNAFQSGRLVPWLGGPARLVITDDIIDHLAKCAGKDAGDALMLWAKLVLAHTMRMFREESFELRIEAMVHSNTIPGWTEYRIRKARDVLLALGMLNRVQEARGTVVGGAPALYTVKLPNEILR
jgi:hypothetical protein